MAFNPSDYGLGRALDRAMLTANHLRNTRDNIQQMQWLKEERDRKVEEYEYTKDFNYFSNRIKSLTDINHIKENCKDGVMSDTYMKEVSDLNALSDKRRFGIKIDSVKGIVKQAMDSAFVNEFSNLSNYIAGGMDKQTFYKKIKNDWGWAFELIGGDTYKNKLISQTANLAQYENYVNDLNKYAKEYSENSKKVENTSNELKEKANQKEYEYSQLSTKDRAMFEEAQRKKKAGIEFTNKDTQEFYDKYSKINYNGINYDYNPLLTEEEWKYDNTKSQEVNDQLKEKAKSLKYEKFASDYIQNKIQTEQQNKIIANDKIENLTKAIKSLDLTDPSDQYMLMLSQAWDDIENNKDAAWHKENDIVTITNDKLNEYNYWEAQGAEEQNTILNNIVVYVKSNTDIPKSIRNQYDTDFILSLGPMLYKNQNYLNREATTFANNDKLVEQEVRLDKGIRDIITTELIKITPSTTPEQLAGYKNYLIESVGKQYLRMSNHGIQIPKSYVDATYGLIDAVVDNMASLVADKKYTYDLENQMTLANYVLKQNDINNIPVTNAILSDNLKGKQLSVAIAESNLSILDMKLNEKTDSQVIEETRNSIKNNPNYANTHIKINGEILDYDYAKQTAKEYFNELTPKQYYAYLSQYCNDPDVVYQYIARAFPNQVSEKQKETEKKINPNNGSKQADRNKR